MRSTGIPATSFPNRFQTGLVCFGNQTGVGLVERKVAVSTTFTNSQDFWLTPSPNPPTCRMPEEEYLTWALQQEFRTEWVEGEVVYMSPASAEHSELRGWLLTILRLYVSERQLGRVLDDVMIPLAGQRRVRVPDLFFVQQERLNIIRRATLAEPPDLALEIVSPDSSARDWREKHQEFERAGIAEYWVVDPNHEAFEVYRLNSEQKYQVVPVVDGQIHSEVIAGFWLRHEWFATEHRPSEMEVLKTLGVL